MPRETADCFHAITQDLASGIRSKAAFDFGPVLKADNVLVGFEADTSTRKLDAALRQLAEHVLHRRYCVHQRRYPVYHDAIAHLSQDRGRKYRRPPAFKHICQQRRAERLGNEP